MAKGKRRRMARAAGRMAVRAGKGFARRFREKRNKGMMVSLATAAAAGYYEGGTNISDLVLFKPDGDKTPDTKMLTKTDAAGLAAGAFAVWSGNEFAYDVAMGLLPVTVHRMVKARSLRGYGGRPPKAEGDFDETGADDDVIAYAGAVELDEGI